MATQKSQRIGIWIITLVLAIGTVGSFLVMALSIQNQSIDENRFQEAYSKYQSDIAAQTKELSDKYYSDFSKYESKPAKFDASGVKSLTKKDLVVGTGAEIAADSEYNAYYIGWNPKGVVFDSSISGTSLKAPIAGSGLIEGWTEGVVGMKMGGVRELSIPSELAYGSTGSGDNIPADTPIKFIVMVIPKIDEVPIPDALMEYYKSAGYL